MRLKKAKLPLKKADLARFRDEGYLYVSGYFSAARMRSLQRDIHDLMGLLLEREGLASTQRPFTPATFDSGLQELIGKNRELGSVLYEAVKKLPSHIALACDARNLEASRFLLQTRLAGFAARGWGLRLDHPGEDLFNTQLHQEYVSQICGPKGVVFWVPLRRIDATIGPLVFYPGSHREGVFPIEVAGAGSYGLRIHDEEAIERRYRPLAVEVEVGDALLMDFLLLHKSSPNRSRHTRWAMLTRYFDFTDPTARRIGWVGGLQEGHPFNEVFPELTVSARSGSQ